MLLVAFAAMVAVTGFVVLRAGRSMRLGDLLVRLQDTTAEIRVRLAVVLLVAFVAFATRFGLESILGAFLAGAVVSLVDRDSSSHPHLRTKLEAIGFGFVVPVFFVSSGIKLDLTGLMHSPGALVRVPVFLAILLVVRGVPALLSVRELGVRATVAVGLLQATSLPFLVTATQIGLVARQDLVGDRRRDRVRRPAVGTDLPADGARAATRSGSSDGPSPRAGRAPGAERGQQLIARARSRSSRARPGRAPARVARIWSR